MKIFKSLLEISESQVLPLWAEASVIISRMTNPRSESNPVKNGYATFNDFKRKFLCAKLGLSDTGFTSWVALGGYGYRKSLFPEGVRFECASHEVKMMRGLSGALADTQVDARGDVFSEVLKRTSVLENTRRPKSQSIGDQAVKILSATKEVETYSPEYASDIARLGDLVDVVESIQTKEGLERLLSATMGRLRRIDSGIQITEETDEQENDTSGSEDLAVASGATSPRDD
jgi:hypothetical protein